MHQEHYTLADERPLWHEIPWLRNLAVVLGCLAWVTIAGVVAYDVSKNHSAEEASVSGER